MNKKMLCLFAGAFAALCVEASSAFAQNGSEPGPSISLPGGATTLQEKFSNWIVTCSVENSARICAASQQLMQQNGQRVLAVEIKPERQGARVDVILPFGVLVSDGITYQIGSVGNATAAKIKTCFPGGCVSTFRLDQAALSVLRNAKVVKISAKIADNDQKFDMDVSLDGFSGAYDRLSQLLK